MARELTRNADLHAHVTLTVRQFTAGRIAIRKRLTAYGIDVA